MSRTGARIERNRAARTRRRALSVEALEMRRLLTAAPQVIGVQVAGQSWSPSFLAQLHFASLGNGRGYAIPVASAAQLQSLPWGNINQIQIAFSKDVDLQQSDLSVVGVNGQQHTFSGFAYAANTFTATWTLSTPLQRDNLLLILDGHSASGVRDSSGQLLDGEWTNGTNSFPSGNATSGGDFAFALNVVPADGNHDGVVNGLDIGLIASHWLQAGAIAGDGNGDSVINGLDIAAVASQWLGHLAAPAYQAVTTTALASLPATITYGQTVNLAASVATIAPSMLVPGEGFVTFVDSGQTIGAVPVVNGRAALNNVQFSGGTHAITAIYSDSGGIFGDSTASTAVPFTRTIAGSGVQGFGGDGGPATSASLNLPEGAAVDALGNVYIVDSANHLVRKVDHATGIITTIAGNGTSGFSGDNGPATAAALNAPAAVMVNSSGDLYIVDQGSDRIRMVDHATGMITTVAGSGVRGFAGDNGPATSAQLFGPYDVTADRQGNLFIADFGNNRVRRVDHFTGDITTVAGNGVLGYEGDNGPATEAALDFPAGVAIDAQGNLFIADAGNNRVRKVDYVTGVITTIAGIGSAGYSGDNGPATAAQLSFPTGVVFDPAGNLLITDENNHVIRQIDHNSGVIATIAGNATAGYSGDNGPATSAQFDHPARVAVDGTGNLFIVDEFNARIRQVSAGTNTVIVAPISTSISLSAPSSRLTYGLGVTLDATVATPPGSLVPNEGTVTFWAGSIALGSVAVSVGTATLHGAMVPAGTSRVTASYSDPAGNFTASTTSLIDTLAGNGTQGFSGDDGPAADAVFSFPYGVTANVAGDLFIADSYNGRIRKIDHTTGTITTVAGNGYLAHAGDGGPATGAALQFPIATAVDSVGNLFISEAAYIRRVDHATGVITTVAGNGSYGFSGDNGPATSAALYVPDGLAVDSAGNLFIADWGNKRIRRVDQATGIITTVAGDGSFGFSGDNGSATTAQLSAPSGVALDGAGNLLIADTYNHRIRKVDHVTGVITTIVGNGAQGHDGDNGPAINATLSSPQMLTVDAAGNLFISESGNQDIRVVSSATGLISTVAGTQNAGYSGDNGPASFAALNAPSGVAVDPQGNLYIADSGNQRIREVRSGVQLTVSPGRVTTSMSSFTAVYGQTISLTANITAVAAGAVTPNEGLVTFSNGSNFLGTAPVIGGTAVLNGLSLPVGVNTISAAYSDAAGNYTTALATVGSTSRISVFAGGGTNYPNIGDNGPAIGATMNASNLAVDAAGNVFIADGYRVRKVDHATGIITTVAGNGDYDIGPGDTGDGGLAVDATLNAIAVAVDNAGHLFISSNFYIRDVDLTTGIISSIGGYGEFGQSCPGLLVDQDGNLLITSYNSVVKVDRTTGMITTIAQDPNYVYGLNPTQLAMNAAGDLFIVEQYDQDVEKVDHVTGILTTFAGSGWYGAFSGDNGPATSAEFNYPYGIAVDVEGNVFIADSNNDRVRRVDHSSGVITTVVGTGAENYSGDGGAAGSAGLYYPVGLVFDADGNLLIAEGDRIRKVEREIPPPVTATVTVVPSSTSTALAVSSTSITAGQSVTVTATVASVAPGTLTPNAGSVTFLDGTTPLGTVPVTGGLAVLSNVMLPVGSHAITATYTGVGGKFLPSSAVIVPSSIINTMAGSGTTGFGGDNGAATASTVKFNTASGVAIDATGNVFIADTNNNRIRRVDHATGVITTVAGSSATGGYGGDNGPATSALLNLPKSVALDADGNLYIADTFNHRIRKVDRITGIITTVAGSTSTGGYGGDNGQATSAKLFYPNGVALDASGNIYIADSLNSRIRFVNHGTGVITTIAGTATPGFSGDGGAATSAKLRNPSGVALDSAGNLYIADTDNNRIRRVDHSTGLVTTVAGNGTAGYSGDNGLATAANLQAPGGVAIDPAGNLIIADKGNNRVRAAVVGGVITTIVGDGIAAYNGDNRVAATAELRSPVGAAFDSAGNLYIVDQGNGRVRKVIAGIAVTVSAAGGGSGNAMDAVAVTSDGASVALASAMPTPALPSTSDLPGHFAHSLGQIVASLGRATRSTITLTAQSYAANDGAAKHNDGTQALRVPAAFGATAARSRNGRITIIDNLPIGIDDDLLIVIAADRQRTAK